MGYAATAWCETPGLRPLAAAPKHRQEYRARSARCGTQECVRHFGWGQIQRVGWRFPESQASVVGEKAGPGGPARTRASAPQGLERAGAASVSRVPAHDRQETKIKYCKVMLLAAMFAVSAAAEVIDRIAVSVANLVITTSDLDREIRVNAFLDGVQPDFTPAAKRSAADRMVEQKLIRRELETARYPTPDPAEVEPVLAAFKKQRYPNDAAYQAALQSYGITDQQVRDELLWQRTLLRFIEVRFRPGVQVSDKDIQDYFDRTVAPAARAAHPGQPVALEDYRAQIESTLTGQRVDQEVDTWLKNARRRTAIVYHEEALK